MASTTSTSLAAPILEDSMEVSTSPAGHTFDNDIDIDFGDYGGSVQLTDDERMLEDGEQTRPATATDDMMDDDDHTLASLIVEEVMHDDPVTMPQTQPELDDEELIDYDDEWQDQAQPNAEDTAIVNADYAAAKPSEVVAELDFVDDEIVRQPEDATVPGQSAPLLPDVTEILAAEDVSQEAQLNGNAETVETDAEIFAQAGSVQEQDVNTEEATQRDQATRQEEDAAEASTFDKQDQFDEAQAVKVPPRCPGTLDTAFGHVSGGPSTPTDTGLHPVTVRFADYEMPLFKSRLQPDGLLKDDNLASISLSSLMQSCRERLPIKLGVSLTDGQEVVLTFDNLAVMLSESHADASRTSLYEIIQVFLELHRNDGTEDPPPLSITLSLQLKLRSSLEMFKTAASRGQGMSTFVSQQNAENTGGFHGEEVSNAQSNEDSAHYEGEYFAAGQEEHYDGAEYTHTQEFVDGEYPPLEEEDEQQAYQDAAEDYGLEDQPGQYGDGDEQEETRYDDYEEHQNYPDPDEEIEEQEDQGEYAAVAEEPEVEADYDEAKYDEADYDEANYNEASYDEANYDAAHVNAEAGETFALGTEAALETVRPEPAATSATVRYDLANDTAESHVDHSIDEFSASLNEFDTGEAEEAATDAQPQDDAADAANIPDQEQGAEPETAGDPDQLALNLGSEDFLNEAVPDQQDDFVGGEYGEQHYNETGEELTQYEENDYAQADNVDDDQQGDYQPGEDDEQFHTAYDLFDGNEDDQVPEAGEQKNGEAHNDEDDIGFDDDEIECPDPPAVTATGTYNSPLGKRSFYELEEEDDFEFEEPESKKARAG